MRKFMTWLLICCFVLSAIPLALAEEKAETFGEATVHTGNGGTLNMRKSASRKADRVLRVPDGAIVSAPIANWAD